MLKRPALLAREHCFVDGLSVLCRRKDAAAAWAAQSFVRREGNHVGKRHRVGVSATSNKARQVRDVKHHVGAYFVGNFFERLGLNTTGITRGASHDHARTVLKCQAAHFVKVDAFVGNTDFV